MRELQGPLARILIRYGVGAAIAAGWLSEETGRELIASPDVVVLVAAGIGALVEAVYALAKRQGWAT